jgi:hypothetical protein
MQRATRQRQRRRRSRCCWSSRRSGRPVARRDGATRRKPNIGEVWSRSFAARCPAIRLSLAQGARLSPTGIPAPGAHARDRAGASAARAACRAPAAARPRPQRRESARHPMSAAAIDASAIGRARACRSTAGRRATKGAAGRRLDVRFRAAPWRHRTGKIPGWHSGGSVSAGNARYVQLPYDPSQPQPMRRRKAQERRLLSRVRRRGFPGCGPCSRSSPGPVSPDSSAHRPSRESDEKARRHRQQKGRCTIEEQRPHSFAAIGTPACSAILCYHSTHSSFTITGHHATSSLAYPR